MSKRRATPLESPPPPPAPPVVVNAAYQRLLVADLFESPLNPRKKHDDVTELAESIRLHDLIEPIVVRASVHEPGKFEIVAGSRRHRAAQLAGRVDVPVMVRDLSDSQLLELALQENMHRASMSAIEEARALEKLQQLDGIYRDNAVLAGKIGRSETYVRDRLKLLKLAPIVIDALDGDAISAKHAERIARLPLELHGKALLACFSMLHDSTDESMEIWDEQISLANREGLPTVDSEIDALIRAGRWDLVAPALVGLRKFDEWAERHGKADISDREVQETLLSQMSEDDLRDGAQRMAREDADDEYIAPSMLQLSQDGLGASEAVRLLDVCVDKRRCETHWPKAKKGAAGKSSGKPSWQVEQEKAAAERTAWDAVVPKFLAAIADATKGAKRTPSQLVELLMQDWDIRNTSKHYGVTLTDATAAQFAILASLSTYSRGQLKTSCKELGIAFDKIAAAIDAEEKAAAAPVAKPAKKKAARAVLRKGASAGTKKALAKKGSKKR